MFRDRNVRKFDTRSDLTSELLVQSDVTRRAFEFATGLKRSNHFKHSSLDTFDAYARLFGAAHINSAHTLYASLYAGREHEDKLSANAPAGIRERIRLMRHEAKLGLRRDAGRLWGLARVMYRSEDYTDVEALDRSRIDQDVRDTREYEGLLRVGYRFSPGYQLVATSKAIRIEKSQRAIGAGNSDQDGERYETLAALEFETSRVIRWRFGAGLTRRSYDHDKFKSTNSAKLEGRFEWLPAQNVTLLIDAISEHQEIDGAGSLNGARVHTIKLNSDIEFYRNLIFTINGEYKKYDFVGSSRTEDLFSSGVKLQYYHTKRLFAAVGYDYVIRQSNDTARNLRRNIFWGSVKLQF